MSFVTHVNVLSVDAGPGLQQDVGSVHISCQHGAVQRRVPVHLVHGAHRGVIFDEEVGGLGPTTEGRYIQHWSVTQ